MKSLITKYDGCDVKTFLYSANDPSEWLACVERLSNLTIDSSSAGPYRRLPMLEFMPPPPPFFLKGGLLTRRASALPGDRRDRVDASRRKPSPWWCTGSEVWDLKSIKRMFSCKLVAKVHNYSHVWRWKDLIQHAQHGFSHISLNETFSRENPRFCLL